MSIKKRLTELKRQSASDIAAEQEPNIKRIRGPKLAVLIKSANGVPFEEGLRYVDEKNFVIASNKRLDKALVNTDEWKLLSAAFPCWTGTITAFRKGEERLGKTIEYVDPKTNYRWIFPVPEEHRDKKNAILVAEHPDFMIESDRNDRIVRAAKVDLVESFPAFGGRWYGTDAEHGIPIGPINECELTEKSRSLLRFRETGVVPVVRVLGDDLWFTIFYNGLNRRISIDNYYSAPAGIIVEAP